MLPRLSCCDEGNPVDTLVGSIWLYPWFIVYQEQWDYWVRSVLVVCDWSARVEFSARLFISKSKKLEGYFSNLMPVRCKNFIVNGRVMFLYWYYLWWKFDAVLYACIGGETYSCIGTLRWINNCPDLHLMTTRSNDSVSTTLEGCCFGKPCKHLHDPVHDLPLSHIL